MITDQTHQRLSQRRKGRVFFEASEAEVNLVATQPLKIEVNSNGR